MELRAFIEIFLLHKILLFTIIAVALFIGAVYYFAQPQQYRVSVTLNIARTGITENRGSENYASFYRLQADERFADTVVRWLESPRIVADILGSASIDTADYTERALRHVFSARRLSSQVIDVQFMVSSPDVGEKQVAAMMTKLNETTVALNNDHISDSWFHIVSQKPIIRYYEKSLPFVLGLSFLLGAMIGFVVVVMTHYYREDAITH